MTPTSAHTTSASNWYHYSIISCCFIKFEHFHRVSQAHGAEILCAKCGSPTTSAKEDLASNSKWLKFRQSLKDKGYFKV